MRKRAKIITTFFYLGHSPLMPGTLGSLAGLGVYFLVKNNEILYGFAILFLFLLGALFAGEAEKVYRTKDPRMIIIDEVCGMLLSLFCVPSSMFSIVLGFFLFRMFDMLKPSPAKKLEKLAGSMGIMFDDIVAGIYTNIILQVLMRFGALLFNIKI